MKELKAQGVDNKWGFVQPRNEGGKYLPKTGRTMLPKIDNQASRTITVGGFDVLGEKYPLTKLRESFAEVTFEKISDTLPFFIGKQEPRMIRKKAVGPRFTVRAVRISESPSELSKYIDDYLEIENKRKEKIFSDTISTLKANKDFFIKHVNEANEQMERTVFKIKGA